MTYNSAAIAAHFDQLGPREWDRFDRTLGDRVSLALHSRVLEQFTLPGGRALDIGAGPGRFTEQLHRLGCRVVRPGGMLLLSVMSLWGTVHRHLGGVLTLPEAANRSIVATGDLTEENDPASTHHCHMYRAAELRSFLDRPELALEWLSASSAITTGVDSTVLPDERSWGLVLDIEARACTDEGYLDAGTHLIAAVRRRNNAPAA